MRVITDLSRDELLETIEKSLDSVEKIKEIDEELAPYYTKKLLPDWIEDIIKVLGILLSLIVGLPSLWTLIRVIFDPGFYVYFVVLVIGAIILPISSLHWLRRLLYKYSKNRNLRYQENHAESMNKLIAEKEAEEDYLQNDSPIPSAYQNENALLYFRSYLINYRADNFRECANLYEEESKFNALQSEIEYLSDQNADLQSEISNLANETRRTNAEISSANSKLRDIEYKTRY